MTGARDQGGSLRRNRGVGAWHRDRAVNRKLRIGA